MRRRLLMVPAVLFAAVGSALGQVEFNEGRYISGDRTFQTKLILGSMSFDEGEVKETRRAYDNGTGEEYKGYLSNYTLDELGFDDNYATFGLGIERQWTFVTLQLNAKYSNPHSDAVAHMHETDSHVPASEMGYYIGVDEVKYNGKKYEYMKIPEGQEFSADVETMMLEFNALITPVSINTYSTHWTPWLHVGFLALGGSYEIDAGPAQGVIQYEVPPKDYVVGGKGTGWGVLGMPEIGLGGEARFFWFETPNGDAEIAVQGDYAIMQFDGAPGSVGINLDTTRNVDLDYSRAQIGVSTEIPIAETMAFVFGLSYQYIHANVKLDSIHRDESEQEDLSEKYDKEGTVGVSEFMATVGLKF